MPVKASEPVIELDVAKTLVVLQQNLVAAREKQQAVKDATDKYYADYKQYELDVEAWKQACYEYVIVNGRRSIDGYSSRYGRIQCDVAYVLSDEQAKLMPQEPKEPEKPRLEELPSIRVSVGRDYFYRGYLDHVQSLINTLMCTTQTTVPTTLLQSIQSVM